MSQSIDAAISVRIFSTISELLVEWPRAIVAIDIPNGVGLSAQAFNILAKIREVDAALDAPLQARVVEMHPELAFWAMNGSRPLAASKKSTAGRQNRLDLLTPFFGDVETYLGLLGRRRAAVDDLLDAFAALWTARRVASGEARRLPESPPLDSAGLHMEIWY